MLKKLHGSGYPIALFVLTPLVYGLTLFLAFGCFVQALAEASVTSKPPSASVRQAAVASKPTKEPLYVITTRPNGKLYETSETTLEILKPLAAAGETQAMMTLSNCYGYGWCQGIPKDASLEFEWAKKAAFAGHPEGMGDMAQAYRKGQFVVTNKTTSYAWLKLALLRGFPDTLGVYQLNLDTLWETFTASEKATTLQTFKSLQSKIPKLKVTRIAVMTP